MTVEEIKRALEEMHKLCRHVTLCANCDFRDECRWICDGPPCTWPF